jgi:hypothetical protein
MVSSLQVAFGSHEGSRTARRANEREAAVVALHTSRGGRIRTGDFRLPKTAL